MEPLEGRLCASCGRGLDASAMFCSRCGAPASATPPSALSKWYHNVWFVLAMLFLVLGPFGLPLVWKNPRFSRHVKLLLIVLTVAYTLCLIYGTIATVRVMLNHFSQLNALSAF